MRFTRIQNFSVLKMFRKDIIVHLLGALVLNSHAKSCEQNLLKLFAFFGQEFWNLSAIAELGDKDSESLYCIAVALLASIVETTWMMPNCLAVALLVATKWVLLLCPLIEAVLVATIKVRHYCVVVSLLVATKRVTTAWLLHLILVRTKRITATCFCTSGFNKVSHNCMVVALLVASKWVTPAWLVHLCMVARKWVFTEWLFHFWW